VLPSKFKRKLAPFPTRALAGSKRLSRKSEIWRSIYRRLNAEQCLDVTGKIIGIYREKAEKRQFGKFIDLSAESTSSASLFCDAIFII